MEDKSPAESSTSIDQASPCGNLCTGRDQAASGPSPIYIGYTNANQSFHSVQHRASVQNFCESPCQGQKCPVAKHSSNTLSPSSLVYDPLSAQSCSVPAFLSSSTFTQTGSLKTYRVVSIRRAMSFSEVAGTLVVLLRRAANL
jgi:hypothetical protein